MIKVKDKEDGGWNSNDPAIGGISCKEASAFMTSLGSAFRAMLLVQRHLGYEGLIDQVVKMLQQQVEFAKNNKVEGPEKEDMLGRAVSTLGQAMAMCGCLIPIDSARLAEKTYKGLLDAVNQLGHEEFDSQAIRFKVKSINLGKKTRLMVSIDPHKMVDQSVEAEKVDNVIQMVTEKQADATTNP